MEWIAYCTVCGEISRGPNGSWEEAEARVHRRKTGHTTIVGYVPEETIPLTLPSVEAQRVVEAGPEVWAAAARERFGRPFPETYGDWVSLGMSIKEKAGIDDFETTAQVNEHLNHIYEEEQDPVVAQESKRWLVNKAGGLGIT